MTGDISCEKIREKLVNATIEAFGRIDVLVNNAGTCYPSNWETEVKELQPVLDLHVLAPLHLSQLCMPELIKNKGNIVMISSIGGLVGVSVHSVFFQSIHYQGSNILKLVWAFFLNEDVSLSYRQPGGYLHYAIAKGGMQQMMKVLASDVAKLGVRVNSVK